MRAGGRTAVTVAVVALAAAALVAIGVSGPGARQGTGRCLPAPVRVSPDTVAPGGSVTVWSVAADCALGYGRDRTYTVTLLHREQAAPAVRTPVAEDGSFRMTLTVPATFPTGPAAVLVHGSPMDDCDDTGTGSCAGYGAGITVR